MNFEKFTDRAKGFVQAAQTIALRDGHQQFAPEHLLKALLDDSEGLAAGLIRRSGGRPEQVLSATDQVLAKRPKVSGGGAGQPYVAAETARVFDQAQKIADKAGDKYVTVERLLVALALEPTGEAHRILKDADVTPQGLNSAINDLRKGRTADTTSAENAYDALKRYARDLTQAAADGKIDWPRRGDSPDDPDPRAAHQEQPGADRRTRRRQDSDRGRPRHAHRLGRCAGPSRTRSCSPSTWAR